MKCLERTLGAPFLYETDGGDKYDCHYNPHGIGDLTEPEEANGGGEEQHQNQGVEKLLN